MFTKEWQPLPTQRGPSLGVRWRTQPQERVAVCGTCRLWERATQPTQPPSTFDEVGMSPLRHNCITNERGGVTDRLKGIATSMCTSW